MKICCIFKLSQIKICILFISLCHVRGMVCFIEKYEGLFWEESGGQVPPLAPPLIIITQVATPLLKTWINYKRSTNVEKLEDKNEIEVCHK